MADINKLSEQLIDMSERFADAVDGAQGRGPRKSGLGARWLILPAAGAGVYALATSGSSLARQTRKLMGRAKDRAAELPESDLFDRVKEVAGSEQSSSGNGRSRTQTRRRRTGQTKRRRKTAASR